MLWQTHALGLISGSNRIVMLNKIQNIFITNLEKIYIYLYIIYTIILVFRLENVIIRV